jgi:hypothetical protein
MRRRFVLTACLLTFACQGPESTPERSCLELPPSKGPVLARVGNFEITLEHIEDRIREQGELGLKLYSTRRQVQRLVEDQIRLELLTRMGCDRQLDTDPEVVGTARKVMIRRLLDADLGKTIMADGLSDEKLERYYERHREEYNEPEQRRVQHILLPATLPGQKLGLALLDELLATIDHRPLFAKHARTYSIDRTSKKIGGDLLYWSKQDLAEEYGAAVAERVFTAGVPQLIPTLERGEKGWHILTVLARREAMQRSFEETKHEIRERLLKSRRSKAFDSYLSQVRQRFPVAIYGDRIDSAMKELKDISQ